MESYKYDTVLYANGAYQGLTRDGKRSGIGAVVLNTGTFVLANFLEGDPHGCFLAMLPEGAEIHGNFEKGKAEGIFLLKNDSSVISNDIRVIVCRRQTQRQNHQVRHA
jgi:hypothetical protein